MTVSTAGRRVLEVALDRPWLFYAARFLLVGRQGPTKALLRRHLDAGPAETVLDVCCGIGEFAETVDAAYVGVDLNRRFIDRARAAHAGRGHCRFENGDVMALPYPAGHFDKAMFVNALHHFSDEDALRVLREIRRVTRRLVVVVDPDGTPEGLLRRALIGLDRGEFMRPPAAVAALVGQVFEVAETVRYDVGLYTEVLLRCPIS